MQRRLILCARQATETGSLVLFGLFGESLLTDFGQISLSDFADANSLIRHDQFDHMAGDAGARCTLMEVKGATLPKQVGFSPQKNELPLEWMIFPKAAKQLADGNDKRYLQLAIQFLATVGETDQNVIAADYDEAFLKGLLDKLT